MPGVSVGQGVSALNPQTDQMPMIGTSTNDSATAGMIGELIQSTVASPGSGITTNTPANVTSITLTPGDWDVSGVVGFIPAATTSVTQLIAGINSVSATLPVAGNGGLRQLSLAANVMVNPTVFDVSPVRISITANTTIFLVAQATFTVSTMTAYGGIRARRVR